MMECQESSSAGARTLTRLGASLTMVLAVTCVKTAAAQEAREVEPAPRSPAVLEAYIDEALANNLALQQQALTRDQSLEGLREARGYLFPSLDFEGRYSRADGGRSIDVPAPPTAPDAGGLTIPFQRPREQYTFLRVTQPILDLGIYYNYRARRHQVSVEEAGLEAFENALTRGVKVAYFNYLAAEQAVDILAATIELSLEGLRTNESLVANEQLTVDALYRARADLLEVEQQHAEAVKDRDFARSYFNFLLNRPLETAIELDPSIQGFFEELDLPVRRPGREAEQQAEAADLPLSASLDPQTERSIALEQRAELVELDAAQRASQTAMKAARAEFYPNVYLAFDAGIQGVDYSFDSDARYYLASVVVRWNLFRGLRDQARVDRGKLETRRLEAEREEVARQIELEVQTAVDAVRIAERSLLAATGRVQAAREGFRLTSRRYEEGLSTQIDYLDARINLTNSELNYNITRYDLLKRLAELEYATGGSRPGEGVQ